MERAMTVEERIRRAEEIYERRKRNEGLTMVSEEKKSEKKEKKDIKLLKKIVIQLIICTCIYLVIYTIQNNKYIFSEDFINKVNEIISQDIDFAKLYRDTKNYIMSLFNKQESQEDNQEQNTNTVEKNLNNNGIGGAVEETKQPEETNQETQKNQNLSQEEQDILNVKNTTSFIKPVDGTISSIYGFRDTATGSVPKNHTGTDIASTTGTKIKSATNGQVVLVSEEGDYGKHLKIQIGEVSIIYAHCNNIYVKEGDQITQGQEIAEVGSTGNSTGPHLHFEIRISERTVDPQKILEL